MKKTAEEILRKYLSFENALGNGTVTTVPITIIHAMEEYANQDDGKAEKIMKLKRYQFCDEGDGSDINNKSYPYYDCADVDKIMF